MSAVLTLVTAVLGSVAFAAFMVSVSLSKRGWRWRNDGGWLKIGGWLVFGSGCLGLFFHLAGRFAR